MMGAAAAGLAGVELAGADWAQRPPVAMPEISQPSKMQREKFMGVINGISFLPQGVKVKHHQGLNGVESIGQNPRAFNAQ
jgi:hypothetical protein